MGGSGYYLAKRSISKERLERQRMDNEKVMKRNRQIAASGMVGGGEGDLGGREKTGQGGGGGGQIGEQSGTREREKSKFEASEPYRSKKGDRFS